VDQDLSAQNQSSAGSNEETEVTLVTDVRAELEDIDNSDLSEHSQRFEALHEKLQHALTSIDGL
jgi:hypothetical protein